ncbi:MAG: diaminopimelate epimerase [Methyloligellaceae bacterium]
MNGLGNDFAIFDSRSRALQLGPEGAKRVADREAGIGCDQVIVVEPSNQADVFMRILNADGGEVDACGNAARCVAAVIAQELQKDQVSIETNVALLGAMQNEDGTITIDMGEPLFDWESIPLSEKFHDTRGIELAVGPVGNPVMHTPSVANVGNPHCIFWVDNLADHDLASIGPILEYHPFFPERANISLAQVNSRQSMDLIVWERGVGLTKACGTAACAAAVSAHRKRICDRTVMVTLPGGTLRIDWRESDNHILMTGPIEYEYDGHLDPVDFAFQLA